METYAWGVILNNNTCSDERIWQEVVRSRFSNEPMHLPGYASLFARPSDRVMCALCISDSGSVIYPFVLRPLHIEKFTPAHLGHSWDVVSPYGYGGPILLGGQPSSQSVSAFWQGLTEWMMSHKVVSEFVRFPLGGHDNAGYPGEIEVRGRNVVRRLDTGIDVWMEFDHKVRKNVNRARELGVEVVYDEGSRLEHFISIYTSTMARRSADSRYHFDARFFSQMQHTLADNLKFFYAIVEGKVVSTELVLLSEKTIYSFLGGTDESYYRYRPNDLLKYEIIRWGQYTAREQYVLGGGYCGEDGIFQYKHSFAPKGCIDFKVGKRILDEKVFAELVCAREKYSQPINHDFFPSYRS